MLIIAFKLGHCLLQPFKEFRASGDQTGIGVCNGTSEPATSAPTDTVNEGHDFAVSIDYTASIGPAKVVPSARSMLTHAPPP